MFYERNKWTERYDLPARCFTGEVVQQLIDKYGKRIVRIPANVNDSLP